MIPWTLIIIGALLTVFGILGWISLFVLPFFERFEVVYDKDKEIIQSRTDPEFGKQVWYEKKHLKRDFTICVFAGSLMFFAGFYLGYAAKGDDFWLYRKLFPDRIAVHTWDEINENGQYVFDDGRAFTYYVLIDGNKISLSGEPCADLEELKTKLTGIKRENTVIIIDSFAVSSTYHGVEAMLNEIGIDYEETR